MKAKVNGDVRRIELGKHIVADSKICGGQPTFKSTRIIVWLVLEQLEEDFPGMKSHASGTGECQGRPFEKRLQ